MSGAKRKILERSTKSFYKRPRAEEPTTVEELSDFEKLPENVLEEIIGFLPCRDVLELSRCSKFLNLSIARNSKMMDNIVFRFPDDLKQLSKHWSKNVTRNYGRISFTETYTDKQIPIALAPLKNFKNSVKVISFLFNSPTELLLKSALTECSHVCELDFRLTHPFIIAPHKKVEPLHLPHLKVLRTTGFNKMMNYFSECKLRTLDITSGHFIPKVLHQFLQNQPELETLKLSRKCFFRQNDCIMNNFPFKLKHFELGDYSWCTENQELFRNLQSFAESQRESLQKLKLHECVSNMLIIFVNFRHLKTINFVLDYASNLKDNFPPMEYVENLTVTNEWEHDNLLPYIKKFPNVKKLCVKFNDINEIELKNLPELPHLEELIIERCEFVHLSIENLPSLTLRQCVFVSGWDELKLKNVKQLTVEECIEEEQSILEGRNCEGMNHLKIIDTEVSEEFHEFLKANQQIHTTIINN